MNKKLWVVGQFKGSYQYKNISGVCWDLNGIHETEEAAINSCRDDSYFIGPIELNVALPDETTTWPGCYFPKS